MQYMQWPQLTIAYKAQCNALEGLVSAGEVVVDAVDCKA